MENNKVELSDAKIDKEVLDILKSENVLASLEDPKMVRRLELNCFCEFLSEMQKLTAKVEKFSMFIRMCGADKLNDYFHELRTNISNEEKLQEKIHAGHKKPKKTVKK